MTSTLVSLYLNSAFFLFSCADEDPQLLYSCSIFNIPYSPDVVLIHRMDRVHLESESNNEDLKDGLRSTCPERTDPGRLALVL